MRTWAVRRPSNAESSSCATASEARARLTPHSRVSPASVSRVPNAVRLNNTTPARCSSSARLRCTVGWLRPSLWPACGPLPCSATATRLSSRCGATMAAKRWPWALRPAPASMVIEALACSSSENARRARSVRMRPAGVGSMPRAPRSNKAKPSTSSRPRSARVTAGCDKCSTSAAPTTVPCSATATMARRPRKCGNHPGEQAPSSPGTLTGAKAGGACIAGREEVTLASMKRAATSAADEVSKARALPSPWRMVCCAAITDPAPAGASANASSRA